MSEFYKTQQRDKNESEKTEQYYTSRPDEDWIEKIHDSIFAFFEACECHKYSNMSETDISDSVKDWLNNNEEYSVGFEGLKVQREAKNENRLLVGYYDLKFENSCWKNYYAIECKLMNESETQLKEYIYNPTKTKKNEPYPEGGAYRFLINKYAQNLTYGGMLGYVQKGDVQQIITNIKQRLTELEITLENGQKFGQLTDEKLLDERIQDKDYTFQSKHVRCDLNSNQIIAPIHLHHILFDFTK